MNSIRLNEQQARRLMTALDAPDDIEQVMEQFVGERKSTDAELRRAWWIIFALLGVIVILLTAMIFGWPVLSVVMFVVGAALILMAMKGREITGDDKIAESIGQ